MMADDQAAAIATRRLSRNLIHSSPVCDCGTTRLSARAGLLSVEYVHMRMQMSATARPRQLHGPPGLRARAGGAPIHQQMQHIYPRMAAVPFCSSAKGRGCKEAAPPLQTQSAEAGELAAAQRAVADEESNPSSSPSLTRILTGGNRRFPSADVECLGGQVGLAKLLDIGGVSPLGRQTNGHRIKYGSTRNQPSPC